MTESHDSDNPTTHKSSHKALNVVVAGGGTAGHVEPALAVATVLKERGANVIAIGTNRGLETRLVPARGFDLKLIEPVPIPRKPSIELLEVPFKLVKSIAQTRKIPKTQGRRPHRLRRLRHRPRLHCRQTRWHPLHRP